MMTSATSEETIANAAHHDAELKLYDLRREAEMGNARGIDSAAASALIPTINQAIPGVYRLQFELRSVRAAGMFDSCSMSG